MEEMTMGNQLIERIQITNKVTESTDINLLAEAIKTNLNAMEAHLDNLERINHELVNKRDKLHSERLDKYEKTNQ